MSKQKLFFLISGMLFALVSSSLYATYAAQGILTLKITGIGIRHGTPDNAHLGVLTTSPTDQEFSGQFTGYFWVEDMQGDRTGHYTTIQCDGIYGPSGYILTGIYLKAGNTTPTLLQGITGNVYIHSSLYTYMSILQPVTYLYKTTSPANAGVVNIYGDTPRFKIIIPAYAPPGMYSGSIVFSYYSY